MNQGNIAQGFQVVDGRRGPRPIGRIAIAVSRYNDSITSALLLGAVQTLRQAGLSDTQLLVGYAPGAWELPLAIQLLIDQPDVVAAIALGAVIRGETTHDQHLNRAVSMALMDLGLRTAKPVLLGLLTCNTLEQAVQRSGGAAGNKGTECAQAALEMLGLAALLQTPSAVQ
jgi:6,7-dimethyl-8-ribityllumazine synthase